MICPGMTNRRENEYTIKYCKTEYSLEGGVP